MFDPEALAARGLVTGRPAGGRGGTVFFELDGEPLVLRPYRRGGLARRLSADRYVSLGLERSRPMREFALLLALEALELPAPRAHAARRTRHGPFESGALVTRRLPGRTLAERLSAGDATAAPAEAVPWEAIGRCVARFHAAGALHADLNAHNVMLDDDGEPGGACRVALLDFDRGRLLDRPAPRAGARANLERLVRSIDRVAAGTGREPDARGIEALRAAWASAAVR